MSTRPCGEVDLADAHAAGAVATHRRNLTLHQVGEAEEVGHVRGRRLFVHLARGSDLLDTTVGHHGEPVGHRERFLLVVRDVDEGDPELLLQ